jgi:hypothetical protein
VPRNNIGGISGRPLHGDLDFLRRRQDKVTLDNGTCKIVELFEDIFSSVVEIGLPVPGGMAAGTGGLDHGFPICSKAHEVCCTYVVLT